MTEEEQGDFRKLQIRHGEVQQMLTRLRERGCEGGIPAESIRVITVRLPGALHDALKDEAHDHRTSMNKLCISKLLRLIDNQFVPAGP